MARDEAPPGRGCRWRCAACGHVSKWWRAAERHADENGHHRIDVVWGEGEA